MILLHSWRFFASIFKVQVLFYSQKNSSFNKGEKAAQRHKKGEAMASDSPF
jgi:hypothetical protein